MADEFERSNPLIQGYSKFATATTFLQSPVLLVFRLAFGWKMYLSGYRHLFVNLNGTIETFRDTFHVPMPTVSVYVSGITELVGGLLLMLGLATRLVSIPLAINFLVAMLTAGRQRVTQAVFGGQHLDPDAYNPGHLGGLEAVIDDTAFPFFTASLLALAFGPGKASIDYFLHRLVFKRRIGGERTEPAEVRPSP